MIKKCICLEAKLWGEKTYLVSEKRTYLKLQRISHTLAFLVECMHLMYASPLIYAIRIIFLAVIFLSFSLPLRERLSIFSNPIR